MIELITDPTPGKISYYKSILEAEGIRTFVRNENMSGTEGMIPIFHPGLCIVDHGDRERALALIEKAKLATDLDDGSGPETECPACGEKNPSNFTSCWSCGKVFPD